ncbi:MAG: FtsX-like permease family protein [Cyclobacteriaceae bacterium]
MLSNYLKIARRNAMLYKGYTFLNLFGLIAGITSSLLILLWINDEVNMNKFHSNGEHIYQLFRNMNQSGGIVSTTRSIPKPAADLIRAEYPEVNQVALFSWQMERTLGEGDKASKIMGHYVTPEFLDVFSFPLLVGNKTTALNDLNAILISKSTAMSHFGTEWQAALGKTLLLDKSNEARVTGVFDDPGINSTLEFDWLMPAEHFILNNDWMNDWGNGSFSVFLTIDSEEKARAVAQRVLGEINAHTQGASNAGDETLILQKFEDTYLYSNFDNGVIDGGRIDYVRIMTGVVLLILLIACINFMNLTTARADRRSKEVGLRKVMGAQKTSITAQFFAEAFIFSIIAVMVALVLAYITLPYFNQLVGKQLMIDFSAPLTWMVILGLIAGVGILSGSYPAVVLPSFNIIKSLKGGTIQGRGSAFVRKGLVVFQFAISIVLIIGTTVIYKQLDYILNKDIGLDKEHLLDVRIEGDSTDQFNAYKNELLNVSQVMAVSGTSGNPVAYSRSTSSANWEGKDPAAGYEVNIILTDEDFITTMGMEMVNGRAFSKEYKDSTNFIINEVAANLMGFDNPIGKNLSFWGINGQIIGVVKNFHMSNLHEPISPLIITCIEPSSSTSMMIRLQGNISEGLEKVEAVTKRLYPSMEFQYRFTDELLEGSYESERTASTLVNIFAGISILISCLGLFGLSAFTAEQRAKEVGIRKVLGSNVWQIVLLLSKEYAALIFVAFIIAIPFGYYLMQDWLNNFEFRTTLQPAMFIYAGLVSLVIGALTVSFKSFAAANVNPVQSLKNE